MYNFGLTIHLKHPVSVMRVVFFKLGTEQVFVHVSVQIFETLNRVDQVCERLQRAASLLEGRLAELENWSSEAQEVWLLLKERQHRGHWGPHLRTKVSRISNS